MAKKTSKPTDNPTPAPQESTTKASEPSMMVSEELEEQQDTSTEEARPTLEPPEGGIMAIGSDRSAGAWDSKKVNSLWCINETKNAWVSISGVGWVKLSTASDTGILTMLMAAASAKETQTSFRYRKESDNMIHEVYVW